MACSCTGVEAIAIENRVMCVVTVPRISKILSNEDDWIRSHLQSQVERRRGDRSPDFQRTFRKPKFCEKRIGKQSQTEKKPARCGLKRGKMHALLGNQIRRARHRTNDL